MRRRSAGAAARPCRTVAVTAAELPDFHGDPADRLIYATAQSLGAGLISADRAMREYADAADLVPVIW